MYICDRAVPVFAFPLSFTESNLYLASSLLEHPKFLGVTQAVEEGGVIITVN